jgi:hypothetical protein
MNTWKLSKWLKTAWNLTNNIILSSGSWNIPQVHHTTWNAVTTLKMTVFWDISPCSLVEVHQHFRGAYCLHHDNTVLLDTLMMETVCLSETSVSFYETRQCNIA